MQKFNKNHKENIKLMFEQQTGVVLEQKEDSGMTKQKNTYYSVGALVVVALLTIFVYVGILGNDNSINSLTSDDTVETTNASNQDARMRDDVVLTTCACPPENEIHGETNYQETSTEVEENTELNIVEENTELNMEEQETESMKNDQDLIHLPNMAVFSSEVSGEITKDDFWPEEWYWPTTAEYVAYAYASEEEKILNFNIPSEEGMPVFAVLTGTILEVGFDETYGNYIVLYIGDNKKVRYGHLSETFVEVNQVIQKGEKIGRTGNTGKSTGPNLSISIFED